jgi:hypothetical protein
MADTMTATDSLTATPLTGAFGALVCGADLARTRGAGLYQRHT